MAKKILPIVQPTVTSWAWQASTFAILEGNKVGEEWLYSNYIQLVGNNFSNTVNIDFFPRGESLSICPLFLSQKMDRSFINSLAIDPLDLVKLCINNDNYIYLVLNLSDILNRPHFYHDLMIYGYDDERQEIYLADFVFKMKYSFETISYTQFINAYLSLPSDKDYMNDWRGGFQLIKITPSYPPYSFDTYFVKESLQEYLNGTETPDRYRGFKQPYANEVYGLNIYNLLINFCYEKKSDSRPFSVLKDHHKLMIKRLEYMQENNYIEKCQDIIDEYKDITNLTEVVLYKEIKYSLKPNSECLDEIIIQLKKIKSTETQLIQEVYDKIAEHKFYFIYHDLRKSK